MIAMVGGWVIAKGVVDYFQPIMFNVIEIFLAFFERKWLIFCVVRPTIITLIRKTTFKFKFDGQK